MINNFDKFIRDFVEWEFYFVQILDRSKASWNNKTRCIKSYYVESAEYLAKKKEEMIRIAETTWCRIYAHPWRRNKKQIALKLLAYIADCISTETTNKIRRAYETVCGKHSSQKRWIIDIDTKQDDIVIGTIEAIRECRPHIDPDHILETVNGFHLIYNKWFDVAQYNTNWKYVWTIHKNNPTLLYYNDTWIEK